MLAGIAAFLFSTFAITLLGESVGVLFGVRQASFDQKGKVIRTEFGEPVELDQGELAAMEYMIQRPAHEGHPCMKGGKNASAYSGVEEARKAAEEASSARTGDIVQIAGGNHRQFRLRQVLADGDEFGVALR